MAGIVRGSEGLMRILKRLEEDFPQLRYHRQAGLNVCVCVCVCDTQFATETVYSPVCFLTFFHSLLLCGE